MQGKLIALKEEVLRVMARGHVKEDVYDAVSRAFDRHEAEQGEGWLPMAKHYAEGMEYYRGLVVKIGEMLGEESYIADDGSKSQDVLCAKIPEIVEKRIHPTLTKPTEPLALEELAKRKAMRCIRIWIQAGEMFAVDFEDGVGRIHGNEGKNLEHAKAKARAYLEGLPTKAEKGGE